ncbi:MAG: N-6 DNA methylase [Holosporales bacterium]|jgi:type I restriction enzyme M protein|nr:N-6 DNA methylase [Holosporales bacterium]
MLDADIKRTIDNARDILVGKIPEPQRQVDFITTAMIYKFMDDIDLSALKESGERTFLIGDLEKYAFSKLLEPKLGAQAKVDLYAEALEKLPFAESIPELFRSIFKGAFLPFRDPQTLTLFLKEIEKLSYDNSENLGNASEYLLSIMDSQGDAGQFRTPRHIIDFIVEIVNPTKTESILDPACGTAGFLISAYLHIRKQNSSLSPMEIKKLTNNVVGYDISPDMKKLALVNLYLHKFANPKIYEYDTLTSDERWNDKFDVILANPPFMTPKGGIQPRDKFSIRANRSEVLFVDYIAEHLNINGRAGIIVPEGIIFQSANAYKALRKMLVDEDYLYAVASLPAGAFNPYSGVKTSILFIDRQFAKHSKDILFVRIDNDGFNLGAKRRPIEKNDLPEALQIIRDYKAGKDVSSCERALVVSKEKIAENGEYNLSGNRYKAIENLSRNSRYPIVKLAEVVLEIKDGGTPSRDHKEYFGGSINWCIVKDIKPEIYDTKEKITELGLKNSSAKIWPVDSIIISLGATIGEVGIAKKPTATKQGLSGIIVDKTKIEPRFLYYFLKSEKQNIQSLTTGTSIKEVRPSRFIQIFKIPLPPLDVQKKIVAEIENKQEAIDAAQKIIENLERDKILTSYLMG